MTRKTRTFCSLAFALALLGGAYAAGSTPEKGNMELQARQFVKEFETRMAPLEKASSIANWDASISGKTADYNKAADLEIAMNAVYAEKETFKKIEAFRKSGEIKDAALKRQLDLMYWSFLGKQLDMADIEAMVRQQKVVEEKFYTFRVEALGKKMTDNEVESILGSSTDSAELKAVWEGSKKIGPLVAEDLVKLAKVRNAAARKLGFKNFHEMNLTLSEQDPKEIERLFDELDTLTQGAYAELKDQIDAYLAKRLGLTQDQLRPWHYQNRFFQEAPKIYPVDLDQYYKDKDLVDLTRRYFAGMGLPEDDVLSRSDLFEKEGKYQHAYCTHIDRASDIRILCNVRPNFNWMGTMLHESGHALYDKYLDPALPWLLRSPAHTFTTEAVAMLFGRMAANPAWLQAMVGISAAEGQKIASDCFKSLRLQMLVFSRWSQVMYRFEKALYENPDQDLNVLWWRLVQKYQLIRKPEGRNEPDWATKIHIATVPAYYHNYQLGELLASQFLASLTSKVLKAKDVKAQSFVGRKDVGEFFIKHVFGPGARYEWNEMIRRATGEPLTAKFFAAQFVDAK